HPDAALALPRVARFVDADVDAVAALRPDLVLTSSHLQKAIVAQLIERDLTVLALNPTDLEGVFRDVLLLGRLVGALDRARALVAGGVRGPSRGRRRGRRPAAPPTRPAPGRRSRGDRLARRGGRPRARRGGRRCWLSAPSPARRRRPGRPPSTHRPRRGPAGR